MANSTDLGFDLRPEEIEDGTAELVIRLTPTRAWELGTALDRYTQMMAVMRPADASRRSEAGLARALFDAVDATRPDPATTTRTVTSAQRVSAMATLRKHRPDLDHASLIAVIDAAATWADAGEDHMATSLLAAVGGDELADAVSATLTAPPHPAPRSPDTGPPIHGPDGRGAIRE